MERALVYVLVQPLQLLSELPGTVFLPGKIPRTIESLRLQKTSKLIESDHPPTTNIAH